MLFLLRCLFVEKFMLKPHALEIFNRNSYHNKHKLFSCTKTFQFKCSQSIYWNDFSNLKMTPKLAVKTWTLMIRISP